jgi:hypothetical protein
VLNADTGYIFDLDDRMYAEVLRQFRLAFPDLRFVAGVTARGAQDDTSFVAERYRPLMDLAQAHDNCEVMIMTSKWLNTLDPQRRRDGYYRIAEWLVRPGIVHALEPAFVPWATPYEPWLLHQLALHPKFVGGKVSTLDEPHFLYWAAMCKDLKLDFAPHSGDDYGIATAIETGLPLLIGAASSAARRSAPRRTCGSKTARREEVPDGHGPFRHPRLQALRGLPVARGPGLPPRRQRQRRRLQAQHRASAPPAGRHRLERAAPGLPGRPRPRRSRPHGRSHGPHPPHLRTPQHPSLNLPMTAPFKLTRVASLKTVADFRAHCASLGIDLPVEDTIEAGAGNPLSQPIARREGERQDHRQPHRHPPDGRLGRHHHRRRQRRDEATLATLRRERRQA